MGGEGGSKSGSKPVNQPQLVPPLCSHLQLSPAAIAPFLLIALTNLSLTSIDGRGKSSLPAMVGSLFTEF